MDKTTPLKNLKNLFHKYNSHLCNNWRFCYHFKGFINTSTLPIQNSFKNNLTLASGHMGKITKHNLTVEKDPQRIWIFSPHILILMTLLIFSFFLRTVQIRGKFQMFFVQKAFFNQWLNYCLMSIVNVKSCTTQCSQCSLAALIFLLFLSIILQIVLDCSCT